MKRATYLITNIDWLTVFLYLLLIIFGWLNIYAAAYNEQSGSIFDLSQQYGKQFIWICAALLLALSLFLIDAKFFFFFAYPVYALSVISLILVLLVGTRIHGSRSWFVLWSLTIQPSEFAKIATGLALAKYLSSYNFRMDRLRNLIVIFFIVVIPMGLTAIQPDMGTALIFVSFLLVIFREGFSEILLIIGVILIGLFFLTLLVDKLLILAGLLFISLIALWFMRKKTSVFLIAVLILTVATGVIFGLNYLFNWGLGYFTIITSGLLISLPVYLFYAIRKRMRNILILIGGLVVSILFTISMDYVYHDVLKEHQQHRLNILMGIETDPLGHGYNVNQSKIAIGSGGFTGKGFLNGTQTKFDFVPEQSTDFIFCTIGEEWGFIGTFLVIGVFVMLFLRLIKIAERQRSDFSRIYGYGVIAILFVHFFINIGMTIGLLPVIGIPLPFFSYGGSSLWAFTILLFIMIRLDASRMELLK
jgi:rod shape determining protein RodA